MSTAKAGKLLAKALDNSSKDEATTAFSMAFSYAERAGIRLTHRFDPLHQELGGNAYGVNERQLIDCVYVEQYFFIGNSGTHRNKPLLQELAAQKIASHIVDVQPLADCSRAAGGIDFLAVITRRREVF